jgi:hypothetical protein
MRAISSLMMVLFASSVVACGGTESGPSVANSPSLTQPSPTAEGSNQPGGEGYACQHQDPDCNCCFGAYYYQTQCTCVGYDQYCEYDQCWPVSCSGSSCAPYNENGNYCNTLQTWVNSLACAF